MNDMEKNRAEYVASLELTNQNLQRQLLELKQHERWIPQFGSELRDGEARLTLSFGGKNQTAVLSFRTLQDFSAGDATVLAIEKGFQDLINDRFREVVQPEIERLQKAAAEVRGANNW